MAVLRKIKIKKSGFEDAFFVIAVLIAISIFTLVLAKAWNSMSEPTSESIKSTLPDDAGLNQTVTNTFSNIGSTIVLFNKLLPFLIIGLFAFVFIGTAIYFQHPIMIFVGFVILAIAVLLAMIYSNIYTEISSSSEFTTENSDLSIQGLYMQYLPYIVIIMFIGITASIIYFRKGSGGSI